MSGSASGTTSEDDIEDPDYETEGDDIDDEGAIADDSLEDIEVEEEIGGD